jgi:hypothetical protein
VKTKLTREKQNKGATHESNSFLLHCADRNRSHAYCGNSGSEQATALGPGLTIVAWALSGRTQAARPILRVRSARSHGTTKTVCKL